FAETFVLSSVGTVLGLVISGWAVDLILAICPIQLPSFVNVTLDRTVLVFATALTCCIALLMALAPALELTRSDVHEAMSSNSARTTGTGSAKRFRDALIVGEVALTCVLLLTAGLLVGSFRQLLQVDTGVSNFKSLNAAGGIRGRSNSES